MFKPVLLIAEVFYWQLDRPGIHGEIIERAAVHDFYRGVETSVVADAEERKSLRRACERHDLTLLQWLTASLLARKVSLCSTDEAERRAAVALAKEGIDLAHECGAFGVGLVSGADPGPGQRARALAAFRESMLEIALHLDKLGMGAVVETLDREAHKRQALGTTAEGAALIRDLRAVNPRCGLCWDSAHTALLGEDFRESFQTAAGTALQMHLSNAVLDRESFFHGDHHFAPGSEIGFLTLDKTVELLRLAKETGAAGPGGIARVGVESRTLPLNDPWVNERLGRELLREALEKA